MLSFLNDWTLCFYSGKARISFFLLPSYLMLFGYQYIFFYECQICSSQLVRFIGRLEMNLTSAPSFSMTLDTAN